MKSFVITLKNNERSNESANKCIYSATQHGVTDIQKFTATEPSDWKIVLGNVKNTFGIYPNPDAVGACFASHYRLWKHCVNLNEAILILEHDAIFVDKLPRLHNFTCVTLGRPSYVRFHELDPTSIPRPGLGTLKTKHMLGHHAYCITPNTAREFIRDVKEAKRPLEPNDLWMTLEHYPHLQEYYPFPVIADTEFSTVQGEILEGSELKKIQQFPTRKQYEFLKEYYPQCLERQSIEFIKP